MAAVVERENMMRALAAAELWETTGSPDVLRDLETRIRTVNGRVDADFDWDETKNLGLLTCLFSKRSGRDPVLVPLVCSNLLAVVDGIVQTANRDGYNRPLGSSYFWGCNGTVARQTVLLMAADRLSSGKPAQIKDGNKVEPQGVIGLFAYTLLTILDFPNLQNLTETA